jgi:hypothetical protein
METANEFLIRKGIQKVYQRNKRYTFTIAEIVEFLDEYAARSVNEFAKLHEVKSGKSFEVIRINR